MKPETQDQFVTDANGKFVTDANGKLARPDRRRVSNVVDKWVRSGGPLFPPGSGQAIEYVERLWAASPTLGKLTATYGERSGSACSHEDRYDTNAQQEIEAIASWFEPAQWRVFETLVRDGATVGDASRGLDASKSSAITHAKGLVGFIASTIARRKGMG